jgi:protein TonB
MGCVDRGWTEAWKPQGTWTWGVVGSLLVHGLLVAALVVVYQGRPTPRRLVVPVEAIVLVPTQPGPRKGGGGCPAPVARPETVAPKPAPPPVKPKPRVRRKPRTRIRPAPPAPEPKSTPVISTPAPPPPITRSQSATKANSLAGAPGAARGSSGSGRGGRGGGRGSGSGGGVGAGQGTGAGSGSALQGYLGNVRQLLERQKKYPWMARRRHLQGVVIIMFTIAAGGQIESSRIRRSSGHDLLDKAARETLHRVGRFPPLPAVLNRRKLTIEVPLAFRLRQD